MSLIYLDTETTGLDWRRHEVWEIAWAVDDGVVESVIVPHDLRTADPEALRLNRYEERTSHTFGSALADKELREIFRGNTLVGANPAFDARFLSARWGEEPWHYRMIDVESFAMPILKYSTPRGLARISEDLREQGFRIDVPDHSAAMDVIVLRQCHKALRKMAGLA